MTLFTFSFIVSNVIDNRDDVLHVLAENENEAFTCVTFYATKILGYSVAGTTYHKVKS